MFLKNLVSFLLRPPGPMLFARFHSYLSRTITNRNKHNCLNNFYFSIKFMIQNQWCNTICYLICFWNASLCWSVLWSSVSAEHFVTAWLEWGRAGLPAFFSFPGSTALLKLGRDNLFKSKRTFYIQMQNFLLCQMFWFYLVFG